MTSIKTPQWVQDTVFYQIFPDRFSRSQLQTPTWQSNHLQPWHSPPTYEGYKGGNFAGMIEKLNYLQDLGINAIYLNPIFQSGSNHRYHTHDYYQVDPLLGGNQAFLDFLEAAHRRNIKVVLDGVFNHASRGFFFFHDILENGANSAWVDWFRVEKFPLAPYDGEKPANYVGWFDMRALPQFNHDNPEVKEYIMQIAEYWLKQGIDGWRLDVPLDVKTPGFWQEFRQRVKAINPEAYIVAEIWEDASDWLDGNSFDAVMNYLFAVPTIAFTAKERVERSLLSSPSYQPYPELNAQEYGEKISALLDLYPREIQLAQFNLLDSHDTARLLTLAGGDKATVELATLLLLTFPGAPCIYYGNEVGLPGGRDPDCRRGFPPESDWHQPTLNYHKKLIALRHQYPALRTGEYKILSTEGELYVFARILGEETLLVGVNTGTNSAKATVNADGHFSLIYGSAEASYPTEDKQLLELKLPPRTGCILVQK